MICPGELELARALACGSDPELDAHLGACAACRAAWDGERAAIELVRDLPVALPPPERREEVRTAVLAAAASVGARPARRRGWVLAIAATAAAGGAGYLAIGRITAPVRHAHGTVHPLAGARYTVSTSGRDEVVRLSDGAIDVEVESLHPGDRFRVVIGDAELEVRGTVFHVAAHADQLVEVAVAHGRVDVRPAVGAPAMLTAGVSWRPPAARVAAAPAAAAPPASRLPVPAPREPTTAAPARLAAPRRPERLPGPVASRAPSPPSAPATAAVPPSEPASATPAVAHARAPDELAYDEAWAALRGGEFAHAAASFTRVALLAPDGSLVEDARFWRAVALARARRSAEAVAAFRDFLDAHARSPRAGQASAMLGWLLIDARAFDEAARRFDAASGEPDPAVRRSARAGLDALARRARSPGTP